MNDFSGLPAKSMETLRRSFQPAGWDRTCWTVETFWHWHHIYWGIPGQAHIYNKWLNTLSDLLLYVSIYNLLQSLLSSYFSCKQIVFEGVKGTAGVVALDDIEYTIGINCANKVTDPIKRMSRTPRFLFKLLQTVLEVFNVSAQCACSDSVLRNLKRGSFHWVSTTPADSSKCFFCDISAHCFCILAYFWSIKWINT